MDIGAALVPPSRIYFIGIKGTGMCALAELLCRRGHKVSGSDRDEVFYTDGILKELGIPWHDHFDALHIRDDFHLVIHSAAYSLETNPEIAEAQRRGLPLCKYTDALGAFSSLFDSSGIAGVHGKTTITAMTGVSLRGAEIQAMVLAGSAVGGFGNRSTLSLGDKYFVAETCEYRRHFLAFRPRRVVLTEVEEDHQDYYPSYESIRDAFMEYCSLLPLGGELIYCADNKGAREIALGLDGRSLVPYGYKARGDYGIVSRLVKDERQIVKLRGFPGELRLRVPGEHNACNAAAALALTASLVRAEYGSGREERMQSAMRALEEFGGSKRRSEILGEAGGILFMDDYGHHPTAIRTTLRGLKEFYPRRRLAVSFMSHTYSRTASLLDEFASSLDDADMVVLHKVYASAREEYRGGVTGKTLFEKVKERKASVFYAEEPLDAFGSLKEKLREGDLFLTLGAGDNWKLGKSLFEYFRGTEVGAAP